MFKALFWKEWRESYAVLLLALLVVTGINLYLALRLHESSEFQRDIMCFFIWPGLTIYLAYLLFYQETQKETFDLLFSKPLAKHAVWSIKVFYGLICAFLMCLVSFPGYFLVVTTSGDISFSSALLDPYLLIGLCTTISVFSIALFVSSISRRRRSFGIVLGVVFFALMFLCSILGLNPYVERVAERLKHKPVVLSLLILGISPIFLLTSFICFTWRELLTVRRRRAIISYSLSIGVILFILNSMGAYIRAIGHVPVAGDTIEEVVISPDLKTILLVIEEKSRSPINPFVISWGGSIYTMDTDGKNSNTLMTGGCSHPTWSPKGDKIAFPKSHGFLKETLYVMDKDGSNPVKIKTFSVFEGLWGVPMYSLVWSPDGTYLAYPDSFTSGSKGIYHMLNFSVRNRLTVSKADGTQGIYIGFPVLEDALIYSLVWADDGTIYFQKSVERRNRYKRSLWKVSPGETKPRRVVINQHTGEIYWFDVSPKGWVAYTIHQEEINGEEKEKHRKDLLFVRNQKGENVLAAKDVWRLKWSPGGRYLAYFTSREEEDREQGTGDYCTIFDTATEQELIVTQGKHSASSDIRWAPDEDKILFISGRKQRFSVYVFTIASGIVARILDVAQSESPFVEWVGADEILYREENSLWRVRADGSGKKKIFSPGE